MNLKRMSALLASIVIVALAAGLAGRAATGTDHPVAAVTPAPRPTTPPTVPKMPRVDAAQAYRAMVFPVNDAQAAFVARTLRWGPLTPPGVLVADAQPLLRALTDVGPHLADLASAYPQAWDALGTTADAAGAVRQDLELLQDVNTPASRWTTAAWLATYRADIAHLTAAADVLRAELGLRPAGPIPPVAPVTAGCFSGPLRADRVPPAPGPTC